MLWINIKSAVQNMLQRNTNLKLKNSSDNSQQKKIVKNQNKNSVHLL
jgi:hypothetical protein